MGVDELCYDTMGVSRLWMFMNHNIALDAFDCVSCCEDYYTPRTDQGFPLDDLDLSGETDF